MQGIDYDRRRMRGSGRPEVLTRSEPAHTEG
jgi:hypothetical protein